MNRNYLILGLAALVIIGGIFLSIYAGWYYQLIGDKHGKEYNGERIKQNQPIIEDYFIRKMHKDVQLNVWNDPTETHVHLAKSYYSNLIGNLIYESDSYKPPADSLWLKKKLNVPQGSELEYCRFTRTFRAGTGVDSYYFLYRFKGGAFRTTTLDVQEGDSLYHTLK
jgi:hypothetical protein